MFLRGTHLLLKKMSTKYRYIFHRSSTKFICPDCDHKRFVRYIDTTTGQLLPSEYGKCDRSDNCKYWLNPYNDGYAKKIWNVENPNHITDINKPKPTPKPAKKTPPKPSHKNVPIPIEILKQTLTGYDCNTFIQNLLKNTPYPFPENKIKKVIEMYALGTIAHGYRKGAITFPYIDITGNVTAIQVKEFDQYNHTTGQGFYHTMMEYKYKNAGKALPEWLENYKKNEKRISCFFGSHLLKKHPGNTIALVEAPKTAIYGTLYFGLPNPDKYLWLAVYNKSSLTKERFKILQGRNVVLFPDLNAYTDWSEKAATFRKLFPGTRIQISDMIEIKNNNKGSDLADYLAQLDPAEFLHPADKLDTLIRDQFQTQDIELWIIDPVRYPDLTKYNLEILTNEINNKHKINISENEYLQAFLEYKSELN